MPAGFGLQQMRFGCDSSAGVAAPAFASVVAGAEGTGVDDAQVLLR